MITVTPSPTVAPEPSEEDDERDQSEVRLGLSAARREPEQVGNLPVFVGRVNDAAEALENERELERTPSWSPRMSGSGSASPLVARRSVRVVPTSPGWRVGTPPRRGRPSSEFDAGPDPGERLAAGSLVLGGDFVKRWSRSALPSRARRSRPRTASRSRGDRRGHRPSGLLQAAAATMPAR